MLKRLSDFIRSCRVPAQPLSARTMIYLREIADELRRANDISERRLQIEYPTECKIVSAGQQPHRIPKMVHIAKPTVEQWNKRWLETHPRGEGEEEI